MNNVICLHKAKHTKEELLALIIERAQEGLICLLKLQVASEKLFKDELPIHQLRTMEHNLTKLLDLALAEQIKFVKKEIAE